MFEELLAEARLADLERELAGIALARTPDQLTESCRCTPPMEARRASSCPRHVVGPSLFRRLILASLGG